MKKFLICLLAFVMIFAMFGCSKDDDKGGSTPKDEEFALGEVKGNKYESDFIGLGFTLPEGWSFYTDEEIAELNNYVGDMADQNYLDLMKNATLVYDMMAASSSGTDNIMVVLEKKPNAVLKNLNLKQSLEASFNAFKSSFESMGYKNITHEITTVKIDGKTFDVMNIFGSVYGVKLQQSCILMKCNGYLATVTVTSVDEAGTAPLLENIYLLK